jgi:hypothetical protein
VQQPSSTSALIVKGDAISFEGTVYAPPLDERRPMPARARQNGNVATGTLCGRELKADL